MKKILSRKGIVLVIIPFFTILLQGIIRFVLNTDFNTIGITLGALGLGQILPFFYFDHFVANKVLGISPDYKLTDKELKISYRLKGNVSLDEIESLKNQFIIGIFLNLILFLIIICLGLKGYIIWHITFGIISCFVSWYLLIFR